MSKVKFPDEPINAPRPQVSMTLVKATQLHRVMVLTHYWTKTALERHEGRYVVLGYRSGPHIFEFRDKTTGRRYHQETVQVDEFYSYAEFSRFFENQMEEADLARLKRAVAEEARQGGGE